MGFLGKIFGSKSEDPYAKAQPYLEQISPMAREQYNPYIQQGNQAGQNTFGQYQGLTNNPSNFLNQLMSQYQASPNYDFKQNQALKAMRNSAAAGGYAGTEADQLRQGQLASSLASEDMYEWINKVLGLYNTGLQGQEGIAQRGYGANDTLASILGNSLNQQGGLAFQGQQQKNQNAQNMLGQILGLAGTLGGAALGGPAGAAVGGTAGNALGGGLNFNK